MSRDGTYSYDDEPVVSYPLDPPLPWPSTIFKVREDAGPQAVLDPQSAHLGPPSPLSPASRSDWAIGPPPPLPVRGAEKHEQRSEGEEEFDPELVVAKEFMRRPQEEIANHYGFERGANGGLVAHSLQDALSVPDGLLQMKGLDSTAKLVYACMIRVAINPNDVCYASQGYIATKLGLERSVIGHAVKRLKNARLIEELKRKKARSIARGLHMKWYTNRTMYKFLFHPLLKRKCAFGSGEESEKQE